MGKQALSDLKLVEYGDFITAPYCAKLFADMGAEVIKVEQPGTGDSARRAGPFPNDTPHPEKSGLFLYTNTDKLGITLNLETALGVKVFKELVQHADVLVENNAPGIMDKLGVGYETLKQVNPSLIMTSITPFGQTGPYRDFKTTDLITFHMSGYGYVTPGGGVDDPDKEGPLKAGGRQSEFASGLTAAVATMFAFLARKRTGLSQYVDVSMLESMHCLSLGPTAGYLYNGKAPNRMKYGMLGSLANLPAKDGYVCVGLFDEGQWLRWVEVMGTPDWAKNDVFKDRLQRSANWDVIEPLMAEWSKDYTKEELTERGQSKRVPCLPINTTKDVLESKQLAARKFFVKVDHPEADIVKMPGAPYKLAKTPWLLKRYAPLLGEHNEDILCGRLGYTKDDLVKMRQAGVI